MDAREYLAAQKHFTSLTESELRDLLQGYFAVNGLRPSLVHGTGEHGTDLVIQIDRSRDYPLERGFCAVLQVKKGNLTLKKWRETLVQLLEMSYWPLFGTADDRTARRIILVASGKLTNEARISISEFNAHHDFLVEVLELADIIQLPGMADFLTALGIFRSARDLVTVGSSVTSSYKILPPSTVDDPTNTVV